MSGIRLIAFVLSLLVGGRLLAHEWEIATLLVVLGMVSMRDLYGLAFVVVESVLLAQAPAASETLLVVAPVLAGLTALRPDRLSPWLPGQVSGVRILIFVIAAVMAASDRIEPSWEIFATLLVLGIVSMRDLYGLAFVVTQVVLLAEAPEVSQVVLVLAAVFAGVSTAHVLIRGRHSWASITGVSWGAGARFRLRPGASRRLRRWSQAGWP